MQVFCRDSGVRDVRLQGDKTPLGSDTVVVQISQLPLYIAVYSGTGDIVSNALLSGTCDTKHCMAMKG